MVYNFVFRHMGDGSGLAGLLLSCFLMYRSGNRSLATGEGKAMMRMVNPLVQFASSKKGLNFLTACIGTDSHGVSKAPRNLIQVGWGLLAGGLCINFRSARQTCVEKYNAKYHSFVVFVCLLIPWGGCGHELATVHCD